ncbi:hypothetical protein HN419_05850 [Candidatus Woesearchaeota archaeon]|jgi:hypothetical protein|nr:hypothetical protein [Candidatus Woesearchaeota archaeon]MBT3537606.1 hypothetical protein [Candidatus Woesearchaeota archaeon]MBT4696892.1 hypothetical protein [Candidatus Woesearchaeota archaeon]MBT7105275.1 hypothetical protein [Candidatus Woesearchaeota archaeon]MBT7930538.1 hypothetical protein [Candidatus Woesearchaeota archaeon]
MIYSEGSILIVLIVILVILLITTLVASYLFGIYMLIDACKKGLMEWIILFVIFFISGYGLGLIAMIYYFAVYRKKNQPSLKQAPDSTSESNALSTTR